MSLKQYKYTNFKTNTDSNSIFILWEGALAKYEIIEEHLNKHFKIISKFELHWSKTHYHSNIARLYKRTNKADKFTKPSKKFGNPPYKVFIVEDPLPNYGWHVSTSGIPEFCNLNFIEAKKHYRQGLPHPYLVHSTSTDREFTHQLTLLFGSQRRFNDFLKSENKPVVKDLYASNGWGSWSEFYAALEPNCEYAFLRQPKSEDMFNPEFDLDILTDDFQKFASIANIIQRNDKPYKGSLCIDNKHIKVDLRFVGDNYFPEKWQVAMLENRALTEQNFYRLSQIDQYFCLLYHGVMHKTGIDPKYHRELQLLEHELGLPWSIKTYSKDEQLQLLNGFMLEQGYFARVPLDADVGTDPHALRSLPTVGKIQVLKLRKRIKYIWKQLLLLGY